MSAKLVYPGLIVLMLSLVSLTGCSSFYQRDAGAKSSLMDFLYPKESSYVEQEAIPHLRLPLRVGIAYTPATRTGSGGFTEVEKSVLATKVANDFRQLDFVKSIEMIPSEYLRHQGSFSNLDQIRSILGVDVIVLLSFDQSIFTDEGLAALTYWTIVGAYIVPGEKNDTHTLLDAAVYDIQSRKMLFRAPGTSMVNSRATLVSNSEQRRKDSVQGFQEAGQQLSINLQIKIDEFTQRLKESPEEVKISRRPGYVGGGSSDLVFLILLLSVSGIALFRRLQNA